MSSDAIADAVGWYTKNRKKYEDLALEVKQIIEKILESKGIRAYDITHRAKDIDRFREKLEKGVHYDPKEMQDLAGVRIIGLLNTDVQRISDIIRNSFDIDENRTKDKTKPESPDMVGYRSIQFVAKLDRERAKLPDYSRFKNMYFEIQVRTILQHAWAEIQHDE
ncbi:MAG: RelA/SpoT domain-containing protein, partial [Thermoproteota archaeon]